MYELKPCPFCGGPAKFKQNRINIIAGGDSCQIEFSIHCTKCGATAPGAVGRIAINVADWGELNAWHDNRPDAVKAWNMRVGEGLNTSTLEITSLANSADHIIEVTTY